MPRDEHLVAWTVESRAEKKVVMRAVHLAANSVEKKVEK